MEWGWEWKAQLPRKRHLPKLLRLKQFLKETEGLQQGFEEHLMEFEECEGRQCEDRKGALPGLDEALQRTWKEAYLKEGSREIVGEP